MSANPVSVLSPAPNGASLQGSNESTLAQVQAIISAKSAPPPAAATAEEVDPSDELDAVIEAEAAAAKGDSWDDAMKRVPPNVAKLMKNMQADYTRKTQELATQRKELLRERESLSKVKFEIPEVGEYDPFDEGSVQKRIEAEVAKKLKLLLEPMQQEAELLKAESDYLAFLGSNPDFKTDLGLRSEVQSLLEKNPSLDLETAYWAAKGRQAKMGRGKPDADAERTSARAKAAKEAASAVAPTRRSAAPSKPDAKTVRSMSTSEILELAKSMHRAG